MNKCGQWPIDCQVSALKALVGGAFTSREINTHNRASTE